LLDSNGNTLPASPPYLGEESSPTVNIDALGQTHFIRSSRETSRKVMTHYTLVFASTYTTYIRASGFGISADTAQCLMISHDVLTTTRKQHTARACSSKARLPALKRLSDPGPRGPGTSATGLTDRSSDPERSRLDMSKPSPPLPSLPEPPWDSDWSLVVDGPSPATKVEG
jgi:hypothetical protein